MKRILLLTLEYPPDRGGVATYLHAIHALLPTVTVLRARLWQWWPRWLPMVSQLFLLTNKERFEMIAISHVLPVGYAALLLFWLRRIPFVVFTHGLDIKFAERTAWKRFWLRTILKHARSVLVNSHYTKKLVESHVDTKKIVVCYPCVQSVAPKERHDSETITLLTVARLVKRKNHHAVLEALAGMKNDFPKLRYVIVGDGPERAPLLEKIQTVGLQKIVTLITNASDNERDTYYETADIFVLPAISARDDVEGFGVVYLEAARFGLPAIAGRGGGVGEAVIDGKTGILINPENIDELKAALKDLLTQPEKRAALGAAGRERVIQNFSCNLRKELLERIYG